MPLSTDPESVQYDAIEAFSTPSAYNASFSEAYGYTPGVEEAMGSAACMLFVIASEMAASIEQEAVDAAMAEIDVTNFFGRNKMEDGPDYFNDNIGKKTNGLQYTSASGYDHEPIFLELAAPSQLQYPAPWPWLETEGDGDDVASLAIVLGSVGGAIGVIVLIALAILWFQRKRYQRKLAAVGKRSRYMPKPGDGACALVSDVEASTALYEADAVTMTAAMRLHNNTFRYLLKKHYGFEKYTEGDSFTALFHNVNDALSFAVGLQRMLIGIRWPEKLYAIRVMRNDVEVEPAGIVCEDEHVLFRGLRVRIGIDYGTVGECELIAKEICDAVRSGGQVVASETAWIEASSSQVPPAKAPALSLCGMVLRVSDSHDDDDEATESSGSRHGEKTSRKYLGESTGRTTRFWSRQPAATSRAQDAAPAPMVEVSSSRRALHVECLGNVFIKPGRPLHNMSLKSVLSQTLRQRAPTFEPLKALQLSPAFYDAPCARLDPEEYIPTTIVFIYVSGIEVMLRTDEKSLARKTMRLLETECIDKCAREYGGYKCEAFSNGFLLAFSSAHTALAFSIFVHKLSMHIHWSDELLEKDEFSALFVRSEPIDGSRPRHASQVHSESGRATERGARSVHGSSRDTKLVMRGPRMKIGMYEGTPSSCTPHPHTGRAAYTGQLMNRAARIASKAPSGHTLTALSTWMSASKRHLELESSRSRLLAGLSAESSPERGNTPLRQQMREMDADEAPLSFSRSRTLSFESTMAIPNAEHDGEESGVDSVDVKATELGEIKFKGVQEPIEIVHVYDSVLLSRPFPLVV